MAIQPYRRPQVLFHLGAEKAASFDGVEAASQSYKVGDVLYVASGKLTICATNPTSIVGIAAEPASGTTDKSRVFYPAKGLVFSIPVTHGTPASAVTAYSLIGNTYNLKLAGGYWFCDIQNNNATAVQVVGLDKGDAVGDRYGRVLVTFIDSVVQTGSSAFGSALALTDDNGVTFRATSQKIYSTGANTLDLVTGTTMNIAANAAEQTVNIGNTTGASAVNIKAGTGNITVEGVAATTITVGKADQTGTIKLGESTATNQVDIGTGNGNKTVNVATGTGTLTFNVGTGATGANAINVGTGNAVNTISIGSHATPANVLKIGGAASTTTVGGTIIVTKTVNYAEGATKNDMTATITGVTLQNGAAVIINPAETADGDCTLDLNDLGAKKVLRKDGSTQATTGDFIQNVPRILVYNTALDTAAGAWVLQG